MWPFYKKKEYTLTPTQELLLALLRAQLWLKSVDDIALPSTMEQWDDLLNLAYKQTVVCFIAAACLRHKNVESIPQDIREELEAVIEENKKIHEYHNDVLVELITKFEEQGLHPILLKGQGIAQLYAQPELRQCGDIDIYFLPEEFNEAKCFMQSLEEEKNMKRETYKHYGSKYKGIDVELHKHVCNFPNPFVNKRFQKWTEECMHIPSTVVINDVKIPIPDPVYGLVSVFAHMWHHFENGDVSLRQMCDVEIMYANSLDSQEIVLHEDSMKDFSLYYSWTILCSVFTYKLGLEDASYNMRRSMQKKVCLMLSIILENGGFSKELKTKKDLALTRLGRWVSNQKTIFYRAMDFYPFSGYSIVLRYFVWTQFPPYHWVKKVIENV